jgi:hypothetical protein
MAIRIAFINLIIPIENIEKHYSGGFTQYKKDNENRFVHDNYLVMKGAMSPWDMESHAKDCEAFGLVGVVEKDGVKHWQDFCVVEWEPTLPCDWLLQKGAYVYHINDKEQIPSENV